jgi:hypothetical protein
MTVVKSLFHIVQLSSINGALAVVWPSTATFIRKHEKCAFKECYRRRTRGAQWRSYAFNDPAGARRRRDRRVICIPVIMTSDNGNGVVMICTCIMYRCRGRVRMVQAKSNNPNSSSDSETFNILVPSSSSSFSSSLPQFTDPPRTVAAFLLLFQYDFSTILQCIAATIGLSFSYLFFPHHKYTIGDILRSNNVDVRCWTTDSRSIRSLYC